MWAYIGIKAKPGTHRRIHNEIRDMGASAYMVCGEIDIICKVNQFNTISEFDSKWHEPISKIGAEENMVRAIQTFIVAKESPRPLKKEPYAFIFLKIIPSRIDITFSSLLNLDGVMTADVIYGVYDVILTVDAKDLKELESILNKILEIPGVLETTTMVVFPSEVYT
ncbi:MAG: Lrp/AsnC family transcriptional regulator [Thaumarchaeota archaeon]|nr:Lrp/AsnC family transcriptional regulator [Nitrososphaerota archaeon]